MKILLSTPFDFEMPGGVNDHLYHLHRQLQMADHEIRILSPRSGNQPEGDDGIFHRIGRSIPLPANGSTARITLSPFISARVRDFLAREQFDIIHLHEPMTPTLHLSVLFHSTAINIGTFHASHNSYFGYNLCYLYGKPVLNWFMNRLDSRLAVSDPARNFVDRYYPGGYQIVPNGIDFDAFSREPGDNRRGDSAAPTVLFVGRFNEPRKGFRYLLHAMQHVQQRLPDARLRVVGPGDQDRFARLASALGVRNLEFTGEVPREDLPQYYAACDVFCAPSTGQESFGIVLLEGMAAGKPVVATKIDGYRTVVRHAKEALLVPPGDSAALAKSLTTILSNRELQIRLGTAGRQRSREFSWHAIARRVVECYREAAERRTRQRIMSPTATSLFSGTRRP